MADERPTSGMVSPGSSALRSLLEGFFASARARATTDSTSAISKGFGRYSYAPTSLARIAVIKVFWALITTMGRSGRSFLILGMISNALPSGIATSVISRSPSPRLTQFHMVERLPVGRTS
jgi:uncharacterized membrane protein YbjE (DUF340 family)